MPPPLYFLESKYSLPVVRLWHRLYRIHHPGLSSRWMPSRDRWYLISGMRFIIDIFIVEKTIRFSYLAVLATRPVTHVNHRTHLPICAARFRLE